MYWIVFPTTKIGIVVNLSQEPKVVFTSVKLIYQIIVASVIAEPAMCGTVQDMPREQYPPLLRPL